MTGTTRRVSYGLDQSPILSFLPLESYALSPDGRYVAYVASIFFEEVKQASIVSEGYDSVLLRDTVTGITTLVSVPLGVAPVSSATSKPTSPFSRQPLGSSPKGYSGGFLSVSANGRYVVFSSDSPILVAGDTNSSTDLFVRDTVTNTTTRISVDSNESQALYTFSGVIDSRQLSITPDGRYIAFGSTAFNLVPNDIYATSDIFVRDTIAGTTEVISTDSNGNLPKVTGYGYGESLNPQITPDGRYVVFGSYAPNLVPGDTNRAFDIFVKDRQTGKTTRVSTDSNGNQGISGKSYSSPSISADGRYVAFESEFTNLVAGDTNGVADVFVKDMLTGSTTRISVGLNGQQSNGKSYGVVSGPSISADGRYVAFASDASNLVPNDLLGAPDVFVYDRQTSSTNRVSVTSEGFDAVDGFLGTKSYLPTISADGRFVAFVSNAANLAKDGFKTDTNNIFLHDTRPGNPSPGSPAPGKGGDSLSGMPNGNPLVGGTTNDVLIAKKGAQTLTGGLGKDRFVFTQLDQRIDRITDFTPKQDKIVLTQLLDRVTKRNYKGNAIADGIVRFTTRGSNVQINIDRNGARSGGLQPLVLVEDLSIAELKPRSNFVF
jgi:Tol biopolymer transport system component